MALQVIAGTNMATTPSTIIKHDGVLAVIQTTALDGTSLLRDSTVIGDIELIELARQAIRIFAITDKQEVRIVIGANTISSIRSEAGVIALVVATNHPVIKSTKRMMRKSLSSLGKKTASV